MYKSSEKQIMIPDDFFLPFGKIDSGNAKGLPLSKP